MDDVEDRKLIFYLERHEGALSRLYRTFAHVFPDQEDFFAEIARQETRHARAIMTLQHRRDDEVVAMSALRFDLATVQAAIAKAEDLTRQALAGTLALPHALREALVIEAGTLEAEFFAIFAFKGEAGRAVKAWLEEETARHRRLIAERLQQVLADG